MIRSEHRNIRKIGSASVVALSFDIVVLGDYFYDVIYTGLPEFPALGREIFSSDVTTTGGAMYITAVSLRRLGAHVGWPATFGDDYYSLSVYQFARAEKLDLSLARIVTHPYRRVTTAMPLHGERAFVTFADPEASDLYDHWLHALERAEFRHVHTGGLDCFDSMKPIFEYARSRGATISMDSPDGPHLDEPSVCRERLQWVDIFMPNAREAMIIAETDNVQDAVRILAQHVPLAVVKDGVNGAWIGTGQGNVIHHEPSIPVSPVIDTTGAGDCFNAGFLYGHIVERAPLSTCLRYGNICGGLSVTGVGGATTAPTHDQLMAWMHEQPVP